jgi:hypothetical protein
VLGEHLGGVVAAAQVARVRLSEPAEVDHARDALARGHSGEPFGAGVLARREVAARASAHRVDQVIGDLHAAARPLEGFGAEHVALVELKAAPLEVAGARSVAHEAADGPTGVGERLREPSADEPGGAGHERAAAGPPRRTRFGAPLQDVVS